jgi:aconitate hydratase
MDGRARQGYDGRGRAGPPLRRAGRCVSDPICARSRHRISGGPEQTEDHHSMPSIDSLGARKDLKVGKKTYQYYSLPAAEEAGLAGVSRLPISLKVLLENLLRNEDGLTVAADDLKAVAAWVENRGKVEHEISFRPARVLMQDFTGVPAVVDLAAMRDAMSKLGADPEKINPLNPVDLVIDHSVMVDFFGTAKAFGQNVAKEYERNLERYNFLPWHRHLSPGEPGISGPDGLDQ